MNAIKRSNNENPLQCGIIKARMVRFGIVFWYIKYCTKRASVRRVAAQGNLIDNLVGDVNQSVECGRWDHWWSESLFTPTRIEALYVSFFVRG